MRKALSKFWSLIFPKPDGSEYTTKELIGRFIVFGALILNLIFVSIRSYKEIQRMRAERRGSLYTYSKHEHHEPTWILSPEYSGKKGSFYQNILFNIKQNIHL